MNNNIAVPFEDMAFTFYLFIRKLHTRVVENECKHLFFFSREGAMLKEMFDCFMQHSNIPGQVTTHYLEVSRQSTFLASLGPLQKEKFQVLFRQYQRISLSGFLKSLALEEYENKIYAALSINQKKADFIESNFAESTIFKQLRASPFFQAIYEQERTARSAALTQYVASFTNGRLPNCLHVVDVGWKGSIQDNLFNWLQSTPTSRHTAIMGYYIGLVGKGLINLNNRKEGLLFSNYPSRSKGFGIFNENRSLYEVLLPARHGGPKAYAILNDGKAVVLHDVFHEQHMIETFVNPISLKIMDKFQTLVQSTELRTMPEEKLFSYVMQKHARMVFEPSENEIRWMLTVQHSENFGVFEQSSFGDVSDHKSMLQRFRYTLRLMLKRQLSAPGFWPYLTLYKNALPGVPALYRLFRLYQSTYTRITRQS